MDKKDYTYYILYEFYTDYGYIKRDILTLTTDECLDNMHNILLSSLKAESLIYLQQSIKGTNISNFKILEICRFKDRSSIKDLWKIITKQNWS